MPVVGVGGLDDLVEGRFVLGIGVGHGADPERGAERRFRGGAAFQFLAGVRIHAHVDLAHVPREGPGPVREEAVHVLQCGPDDAPQRSPRAVPVDVVRIFAARVVLQYPVGDVRLVVGGEDVVVGLLPPFVDPLAQLPVVYGPLFHVRSLPFRRSDDSPAMVAPARRVGGTRCLQGPIRVFTPDGTVRLMPELDGLGTGLDEPLRPSGRHGTMFRRHMASGRPDGAGMPVGGERVHGRRTVRAARMTWLPGRRNGISG